MVATVLCSSRPYYPYTILKRQVSPGKLVARARLPHCQQRWRRTTPCAHSAKVAPYRDKRRQKVMQSNRTQRGKHRWTARTRSLALTSASDLVSNKRTASRCPPARKQCTAIIDLAVATCKIQSPVMAHTKHVGRTVKRRPAILESRIRMYICFTIWAEWRFGVLIKCLGLALSAAPMSMSGANSNSCTISLWPQLHAIWSAV